MKVTAGVEGVPALTLGDIRRLYHETTLWSDSCGVELFNSDSRQRITIKELDADRSSDAKRGKR